MYSWTTDPVDLFPTPIADLRMFTIGSEALLTVDYKITITLTVTNFRGMSNSVTKVVELQNAVIPKVSILGGS